MNKKEYKRNWYKNHPGYHTQKNKEWREKYKKDLIKLKINGCAICGYNKCNRALHFHHVNPEDKKFHIASFNMCRKNFTDELNKCMLLCSNCHMEVEEKEVEKHDKT